MQEPGEEREPNAVPEDHGAIGQGVHSNLKPPHTLYKFRKRVGVLSQAPVQVRFCPVGFHVGFSLRAIEPFDQRGINDRELIQIRINFRIEAVSEEDFSTAVIDVFR